MSETSYGVIADYQRFKTLLACQRVYINNSFRTKNINKHMIKKYAYIICRILELII